MVEIEIDGKKVEIAEGSMVMHAANKLGVYVPHFCYHKKLSIAANCRMCLVEVEKAPKPMPACATPVSDGMKVFTKSEKAVDAQKSVMEFLLINHPLDCPICDQGGECQLQDLAVGYGGSSSTYSEEKRVVFHKPMGPLISAEEMSRCIHCTRCVRFGQEVAGVMELGMANRGEHAEIMSFVGRSIDSELSGNMIDICPVGALTSKPFRYSARTWELSRRKTIAPHDSLGSNITTQIKSGEVMRVVPLENPAVNECWISDKDRFSYEGLLADDRLTDPMIKRSGNWETTDWQTALNQAALSLATARVDHGSKKIAGLASPTSTLEELYLLQKLVRSMGSDNVDFRLRQSDFGVDENGQGTPWLGMKIEEVSSVDRLLLVGSFLRKDHPVLSARIREATSTGTQLSLIHACDDDLLMPVAHKAIVAPSQWVDLLLQVLAGVLKETGRSAPSALASVLSSVSAGEQASQIAVGLASGEARAILLGNAAAQHPRAADLMRIAQAIAEAVDGKCGVIGEAGNSVGGYLAGATPRAMGAVNAKALTSDGLNVTQQIEQEMRGVVLMNVEPDLDLANGAAAIASLKAADAVVALTAFRSESLMQVADVLLPIAPFTETGGSYVNAEARLQTFNGVVRGAGQSRPAWKVMRVLANQMDLAGFDFSSVEDVRVEALGSSQEGGFDTHLDNAINGSLSSAQALGAASGTSLERIADVPIYASDALVRRAASLQKTADAAAPTARVHPETIAALSVTTGDNVCIQANGQQVTLPVLADATIAPGAVRLSTATAQTAGLDGLFGSVQMERV